MVQKYCVAWLGCLLSGSQSSIKTCMSSLFLTAALLDQPLYKILIFSKAVKGICWELLVGHLNTFLFRNKQIGSNSSLLGTGPDEEGTKGEICVIFIIPQATKSQF